MRYKTFPYQRSINLKFVKLQVLLFNFRYHVIKDIDQLVLWVTSNVGRQFVNL